MLLADQVDHCEARLALRLPQAAAKLLSEHRRALGGPQQQGGVDDRDAAALTKHVYGEDAAAVAGTQAAQFLLALVRRCRSVDADRRQPGLRELARHVSRVLNRPPEAQRAHALRF